eukprot:CAMPEP_0197517760 /NCGR_PEP_ID=MMETSP1318-20131121/2836_1 /TAXON_ID=552666 /ORGANISM="Partenskyella glossopodia, Strain RCC365" /LENGTH=174 /DNA_ID=CAMNT_0043067593 /DNA_START=231 /DNA_END=755 /DNA_ORIENTATION=+
MVVEFPSPSNTASKITYNTRALELAYYVCCMASLISNLYCVAGSTFLSVFATNLALRGPDGSVERAVEGMHEERRNVFIAFAVGLASLLVGMIFGAWLLMPLESAVLSTIIIGYGGHCTYQFGRRTYKRFSFREDESSEIDDFVAAVVSRFSPAGIRRGSRSSTASVSEEKKSV